MIFYTNFRYLVRTLSDVQNVTSQPHPAPQVKGYDVKFCTSDSVLRRYRNTFSSENLKIFVIGCLAGGRPSGHVVTQPDSGATQPAPGPAYPRTTGRGAAGHGAAGHGAARHSGGSQQHASERADCDEARKPQQRHGCPARLHRRSSPRHHRCNSSSRLANSCTF